MNLGRQKDLVRVFITAHYSELSLTDWKLCEILPLTSTYQGWPVKMQKRRCPGNSYLRTRTNLSKIITSQMSTYRNHRSSFSLRSRLSLTSGMLGRARTQLFSNSGGSLTVAALCGVPSTRGMMLGKQGRKEIKESNGRTWIPIEENPQSVHPRERKGPDMIAPNSQSSERTLRVSKQ